MEKQPIKLYLLTGFLGAGKTTFLKRIMDSLQDRKIGILMNEFGSISVDGVLLQQSGVDIVEINNGSVFCSCLKGAFIDALIAYSELPVEYLFVEASGMADPSSIEHLLESVVGKAKGRRYDYRGALCVVDALNFLDQAELLLSIERQVEAASLVLINKVDLVDEPTLAAVAAKVAELNPRAQVHRVSHCALAADFWRQPLQPVAAKEAPESCNTPGNRPVAHILQAPGSFDKGRFRDFLQALAPWTLRMKGFFLLDGGWHQIDVVGSQIEVQPTDIPREASELVVISSQGLPALQQIYANWDERFSAALSLS